MQTYSAHLRSSWDAAFQILIQLDHKWPYKQIYCGEVYDTLKTSLRVNARSVTCANCVESMEGPPGKLHKTFSNYSHPPTVIIMGC